MSCNNLVAKCSGIILSIRIRFDASWVPIEYTPDCEIVSGTLRVYAAWGDVVMLFLNGRLLRKDMGVHELVSVIIS